MPDIYVFSKAVYNIRLEDQYWGLYLVSILICCALVRKDRRVSYLMPVYGVLSFFPFFASPLFRLLAGFFAESYKYEELSHIWLYPVFIPLALSAAVSMTAGAASEGTGGGKGSRRAGTAGVIMAIVIAVCWAGDPVIFDMGAQGTCEGFFSESQKAAYELILSDSESRGIAEPVIWGDAALMAKSRIYDTRLLPLYGKDITEHPEKYSDELTSLKETYDMFEAKADHINGKEDQIAALANAFNVFEGVWCDYVVIADPVQQGADVDADAIFAQLGYEVTGSAGGLLVYRRQE